MTAFTTTAAIFLFRIFAQAPDAKSLFKRVKVDTPDSPEFIAHILRVMAGLDIVISILDQPETLKAELDHLEKQHEGRHIPDNYFDVRASLFFIIIAFCIFIVLYYRHRVSYLRRILYLRRIFIYFHRKSCG